VALTHTYPAPPACASVQSAPRHELDRIQTAGLHALVRRAWDHVPFYRERWQRHGVRPEDISTLGDLRKLPIVGRRDFEEDLRAHPPFGSYQGDLAAVRVQASSGTSGSPTPVFHTQHDWDTIGNFWARRLDAQGVRSGDVFQVLFAYSLFIAGFTGSEGAMKLGALVVPTGSGAVTPSERQLRIAKAWGTTVFFGTPSYVLHLADVAQSMGLDPRRDFKVRLTIHTSEPLTEPARRAIEERWGVKAYDNFGSVETGAPTFECEARDGYHINEDGYIFEVLDPETLEPAAPGEDGVLVVTSLFKEAAPVIRYNLQDVTRFIDEPCRCGMTFGRIAKIRGRLNEMMKIRGVVFYPSSIETALERMPELTREYLVVLDRVGQQDRVTVRVECRPENAGAPDLKQRFEHVLKVTTGFSIDAELVAPGDLGRALQVEERIKAKRIWDRRE
jgi:phenylacetate-CoA ligase